MISRQNSRSTSRRSDGFPGDFIGALPVNSVIHPAGLPIATLLDQALRPPIESAQYTSSDYTQVLDDHRVLASIGTVGDALENAMAESLVDSYKTELIADRVWRSRSQLELATVEYVSWYNHERLHEALGDIPPVEFEQLHQARQALILGNASLTAPSQKAQIGSQRVGSSCPAPISSSTARSATEPLPMSGRSSLRPRHRRVKDESSARGLSDE